MIERNELSIIVKSVGTVVRQLIEASREAIRAEIEDVRKQISTIAAGPKGERGEKGEKGDRGEKGLDGAKGADGKGIDGKDGKDGRDGRDGFNGKDALEIEIIPLIDPSKSYPRGTFAKHRGGIVRAIRNTTAGENNIKDDEWDVIVDGIAFGYVIQGDNQRSFSIELVKTSGERTVAQFSMPVMIYRGIHQAKTEYEKGDTVTAGGSLWHCEAEKTMAAPSHSPDWKLVAKKGTDGKDLTK